MPTTAIETAREAYETKYDARWAEKLAAGNSPTGSTSQVAKTDSYTLALTDAEKIVTITKGSAVTLTVPTNASVAFPIGTRIQVVQGGAGRLTVAPVSGTVTLKARVGLLAAAQESVVDLVKVDTNVWRVYGDVAAS